jgi:hypothetical protein
MGSLAAALVRSNVFENLKLLSIFDPKYEYRYSESLARQWCAAPGVNVGPDQPAWADCQTIRVADS